MNPFPAFHELPASEQASMRQFWLEEKARSRAADPLCYFRLEYPDGSHADSQIFEMNLSQATALNSEKVFAYMQSARKRQERLVEWEQRVAAEGQRRAAEYERLQQQAKEASTKDIPLPDTKAGRELRAFRRNHIAQVAEPEAKVIHPPDPSYGPADALWARCTSDGSNVIRMEGVEEIYAHD